MKIDHDQIFSAGRHYLSLEEFEAKLSIAPSSDLRATIWNTFRNFYNDLLRLGINCELWVDGSFITKSQNPSDIDMSLMIFDSDYDRLSLEAIDFLNILDDPERKYQDLIDVYVCLVYPHGHQNRDNDPPSDWATQWSVEHNGYWLKGFVVLRVETLI